MARERSVIMRVRIASLTIIFATGVLFAAPAPVQEKGGQEEYGPYELVEWRDGHVLHFTDDLQETLHLCSRAQGDP